ncbi:MAG: PEP-CTERM sorting domain-containing protein, partial [Pirellulaceae bacterium]|nr:PEP-CTERM sorting domain-containing protein [Pirellulaceae bacterium]
DLDQHRPGQLPQDGKYHCSPTSAANSLKWFTNHMGIGVVPPGTSDTDLINGLGGAMGTNGGTWNDDMVKGYRQWLANNSGGRQWDVKFQGSQYFQGYTIGQNSPNVSLDWIKQELADGEDVTLTVNWYAENTPGVWTPLNGAHTITLDGYTSGAGAGNNSTSKLLIRDPWYAEGIVERDPESVAAGRLIYEYNTGSTNLRAEVVGSISVSPKPAVVAVNSMFYVNEFNRPFQITGANCLYNSVYSDYVHLGADLGQAITNLNLTQGNLGRVTVHNLETNGQVVISFHEGGLLDIFTSDGVSPPEPFDNSLHHVQFAYGFGGSDMFPHDHVRAEMWINREVFGDFGNPDISDESFFDVFFQIETDGAPGPMEPLGQLAMNGQRASSDPTMDLGPIPDIDDDGNPDNNYPDPPAFEPDPVEEAMRSLVIASISQAPGDANRDGRVDEDDAKLMARHWGVGDATWAMGDFDGDFVVGPRDAAMLAANWGYIQPIEAAPVPEPSILALVLTLSVGVLVRRKHG